MATNSLLLSVKAGLDQAALDSLHGSCELGWYDLSIPFEKKEFNKTGSSLALLPLLYAQDARASHEAWAKPQSPAAKLSPEQFEWLRGRAAGVPLELVAISLALHDLGKTKRAAAEYATRFPGRTMPSGHDEIVRDLIVDGGKDLFPLLAELSQAEIDALVEWVEADFNPMQFVQGEPPASALTPLAGMSELAFKAGVALALTDVAGFAGTAPGTGSLVCNRFTLQVLELAFEKLSEMRRDGLTPAAAYETYLRVRAIWLGLWKEPEQPLDQIAYALARVGSAGRWTTADKGAELEQAFTALREAAGCPSGEQLGGGKLCGGAHQLVAALNADGIDTPAALPEYWPDFVQAIYKTESGGAAAMTKVLAQSSRLLETITVGLTARKLHEGTTKVVVKPASEAAGKPELELKSFELSGTGKDDLTIAVTDMSVLRIDPKRFEQGQSPLADELVIVTGGGGADPINSGLAAQWLEQLGKKVRAYVHVRGARPSSLALDGSEPTRIAFDNAPQLSKGALRITAESRPAPGSKFRHTAWGTVSLGDTYQVLEDIKLPNPGSAMTEAIKEVVELYPGAQAVVFDTGGDVLERACSLAASDNQDHRVLAAVLAADSSAAVCIAGIGMDAPLDAPQSLGGAGAAFLPAGPDQQALLDRALEELRDEGESLGLGRWYGKSTELWRKAWHGLEGFQDARVPAAYLSNARNPWRSYYFVGGAIGAGLVLASAAKLRSRIEG